MFQIDFKTRREEAGKEGQYMDPMAQKLLFCLLIKDQWKNLIGKDLIQKSWVILVYIAFGDLIEKILKGELNL